MRARAVLVGTAAVAVVLAGSTVAVRGATEPARATLVSVGSGGVAGNRASAAPDIAAGGRQIAFQSTAQLPVTTSVPTGKPPDGTGPTPSYPDPTPSYLAPAPTGIPDSRRMAPEGPARSRIYLRDPTAKTTALLSNPSAVDAAAPSVSGDGRLVSYVGRHDDRTGSDIFVADRDPDRGNPPIATRRVSGRTSDVPLQRTIDCPGPSTPDYGHNGQCRPQLSTDGRTLVFPARLSPISPTLTVSEVAPEREPQALQGNVLDLGVVTYQGGERSSTVRLDVGGGRPVDFRAASVTGDTGTFAITDSTCRGEVRPGGHCTIGVAFHPPPSGCPEPGTEDSFHATLRTDATTPDGQSMIALVGDCQQGYIGTAAYRIPQERHATTVPAAAATVPAECPEPDLTGLAAQSITLGADNADHLLAPLGPVQIGRAELVAFSVPASYTSYLRFLGAPDCDLRLVTPSASQQIPDSPPPCLGPSDDSSGLSCTAYVLFRPTSFIPGVATLGISGTIVRVAGTGFRNVVIARHDSTGHGDFAGVGRPTARIVGVDSNGTVVNASEPSVSGDGRHVAFSSIDPIGRPRTGMPSAQVYVHDTDARGNRTFAPGQTVLASVNPGDPSLNPAGSPALSDDGSRVAFEAKPSNGPARVRVRDLTAGRTVSIPPPPGAESAFFPALSGDGSTVAFVSSTVDESTESERLQTDARYLPDLDGGGKTEVLARDTDSALPTIDAHGRRVAFQSSAGLLDTDTNQVGDTYLLQRRSAVTLRPERLEFGRLPIGGTSPLRTVTVRNTGPGPFEVSAVGQTGPFGVARTDCAGVVLHTGESCALPVVFAPTTDGAADGALTVRGIDDGALTARLSGTAVTPRVVVPTPTSGLGSGISVVRLGGALTAEGTDFPAGAAVTLSWRPGLGRVSVTADAFGRFATSFPVFPHDQLGERRMVARLPDGLTVPGARVLVVAPSGQPPGFTTRG